MPSRAPFSLDIPQLNRSEITSLEVRIGTTQINTVKIHISEPTTTKWLQKESIQSLMPSRRIRFKLSKQPPRQSR